MYTQAWGASYAKNAGQWRGQDHYTIGLSYISSNATISGDVSCPSDVPYLSASGAAFCSAYIAYTPPTTTVSTQTVTPAVSTVLSTQISLQTDTIYSTELQTSVQTATLTRQLRRDIQTPASLSTWSPSRISAACSAVATGTNTATATETAATPYTTIVTTQVQSLTQTIPTTLIVQTTTTTTLDLAPIPTPVVGLNIIQNPSFENGQTSWSCSGQGCRSWSYQPAAQAGSGYLIVEFGQSSSTVSQPLTNLKPGASYTLSFYNAAQTYNTPNCNIQAYLDSTLLTTAKLVDGYNGYHYAYTSAKVTPTATKQTLNLVMSCNPTGNQFLFLDNVQFYAN
ncbi:hypothetical protein AUEXF2481DRAFT_578522 [Aureobasidium subglaciale EXF-2481]|uniref:CBM-cenC domain-containing protein n=1 Tax=Aureobasidium subglaciale (strain EXF-2481) TaxID=1043005 RepID=A0A074YTS2_AURSE|nr:uncharacterized protein AUEXF2481DRAFT_578522 [Aureobasidium subglaciale EXF-2481]KEQ90241.1 hypothetical protein AUEXF2481DRAFT_578522 [Aureobasidium subglaciale EXF-2481]